jgi:hypothetical protein
VNNVTVTFAWLGADEPLYCPHVRCEGVTMADTQYVLVDRAEWQRRQFI